MYYLLKTASLALLLLIFHNSALAQVKHYDLDWQSVERTPDPEANYSSAYNPVISDQCLSVVKGESIVPIFIYREKMTGNNEVSEALLQNITFDTRRDLEYPDDLFETNFKIEIDHYTSRRDRYAIVRVYPIRSSASNFDLLHLLT